MPIETKLNGKLTRKQGGFTAEIVKQIASGGKVNPTQAIMKHYNVKNAKTASVMANENLKNPSIREAVEQALRVNGLDATTLAREAGKLATHEVEIVSADVKLRAITELFKLMGAYPDRKTAHLNLNLKGKVKDMTYQEAKNQLQKLNGESNIFVEDAE